MCKIWWVNSTKSLSLMFSEEGWAFALEGPVLVSMQVSASIWAFLLLLVVGILRYLGIDLDLDPGLSPETLVVNLSVLSLMILLRPRPERLCFLSGQYNDK